MAIGNILPTFGIFYDHLAHFVLIWYILCKFGTFFVHLVHFFRFWHHLRRSNPVTDLFALFTASRGKKHVGISTEA
jgi:hypothetical protein